MPIARRDDDEGAWHHVMNRGIARRTLFEGREDIRFFLSRLALATRSRALEIHAFAILSTHFHLLARSPEARLSAAMMWIEREYARWFNRRRCRDGPLFRGRFLSRRVASHEYWKVLVAYIDRNPVAAGVTDDPTRYPWCSAWHYARPAGPPWLQKRAVSTFVAGELGRARFDPSAYREFIERCAVTESGWIVARRIEMPSGRKVAAFDDLVRAAPAAVQEWMQRKARLADGRRAGDAFASPDVVAACVARALGMQRLPAVFRGRDGDSICLAGLLRDLSGLSQIEIAVRLSRARSTISGWVGDHHRRVLDDRAYAEAVALIATAAIQQTGGFRLQPSDPLVVRRPQQDTNEPFLPAIDPDVPNPDQNVAAVTN